MNKEHDNWEERFDEKFIKPRIIHGGENFPRLESHQTTNELKAFIRSLLPSVEAKGGCCAACDGTLRDENNFGRDYGCLKVDCRCHSKPADILEVFDKAQAGKASEEAEEWEADFIRNFYVYDLEKDTPAGAEKKAVRFIRSIIEKVRAEGKEAGYELRDKEYAAAVDGVYQMGARQERKRILNALENGQMDIFETLGPNQEDFVRSLLSTPKE